jgi:hypothetical protein
LSIYLGTCHSGESNYARILKKIASGTMRGFFWDSLRMYIGRAKGVITINAFGKPLSEAFGMSDNQFIAASAVIEAKIYGEIEVIQRFITTNKYFFPQIPEGVDLTKITEPEFLRFTQEYVTKNPSKAQLLKFDDLDKKRLVLKYNKGAQLSGLGLRNIAFLGVVYKTKPLAVEVVDEYGKFFDQLGISKDAQVEILTIFNRLVFAGITTPIDRFVTEVSSGRQPYLDVLKTIDVKSLFRGAMARSVLVALASTTVAEGFEFAKQINEFTKTDPLIKLITDSIQVSDTHCQKEQTERDSAQDQAKSKQAIATDAKLNHETLKKLCELACDDYDQDIAQESAVLAMLDGMLKPDLVTQPKTTEKSTDQPKQFNHWRPLQSLSEMRPSTVNPSLGFRSSGIIQKVRSKIAEDKKSEHTLDQSTISVAYSTFCAPVIKSEVLTKSPLPRIVTDLVLPRTQVLSNTTKALQEPSVSKSPSK